MRSLKTSRLLLMGIAAMLLTGCGLGTDLDDKIASARTAIGADDYRTAIIELKGVAQERPDDVEVRTLLGQAYLATGQMAAAESEFRRARQLGATDASTILSLGESLYRQQKFDAVLEVVDVSSFQQPAARVDAQGLRGDALAGKGDADAATAAYAAALEQDSRATRARVGLARVALMADDATLARRHLSQVLAVDQNNPSASFLLGSVDFRAGRFAAAEQAFAKAVGGDGLQVLAAEQLHARVGLVQTQLAMRRVDDAKATLDRLLPASISHPMVRYLRGLIAFRQGDFETAEVQIREMLNLMPDSQTAKMLMGSIKFAQGQFEQANAFLREVIAQDPENLRARRVLAETRLRLDDPQGAIDLLRPLADSGDGMVLTALGGGDAVERLEQRLAANPRDLALRLQLADEYVRRGESEKAAAILKAPDADPDALSQDDVAQIVAYIRAKEFDAAISKAQQLVDAKPENSAALSLLGAVNIVAENFDAALDVYNRLLSLDPGNDAALTSRASIMSQTGRLDRAVDDYRAALQSRPDSEAAAIGLAGVLIRQEQVSAGQKVLVEFTDSHPQAVRSRLALVSSYLSSGDKTAALAVARTALEDKDGNAVLLNGLGVVLSQNGEVAAAKDHFLRAVEVDPANPGYLVNLGQTQLRLQEFEAAIATFEQIVAIQPENVLIRASLASIHDRIGNADKANQILRQLKSDFPASALAYGAAGDIALRRGDFASAYSNYQQANEIDATRAVAIRLAEAGVGAGIADPFGPAREWLRRDPDDAQLRLTLANAYLKAGDTNAAQREYEYLDTKNQAGPIALNNLAWVYYQQQQLPKALKLAERAHQGAPQSADIADTLGWVKVESGDTDGGLPLLRDAVAQKPQDPVMRYHLGVALIRAGQKAAGRAELERAIAAETPFLERSEADAVLRSLD